MPNNTIGWGQAAANNSNGFGAAAQNNNINWGWIHSRSYGHDETNLVGAEPSFFDKFGTPAAAYSLRDLSGSNPNVIEVRRSSDNAVQDFTSSEITDGSLATWIGAGNDGFIRTWYDQAGANDATQTTASNQPKIVSAGSLVTENGKAAIDFDGVNDYFIGAAKITMDNTAIFSVIKSDSNTQDSVFIQNSVDASNFVALGLGSLGTSNAIGSRLRVGGSTVDIVGDSTFTATDQTLVSYIADNTAGQMFVDGTEETNAVDCRSGGAATTIGARGDGNNPFNGAMQEVIFFASDQSANRTAIEANINDYYSIY